MIKEKKNKIFLIKLKKNIKKRIFIQKKIYYWKRKSRKLIIKNKSSKNNQFKVNRTIT